MDRVSEELPGENRWNSYWKSKPLVMERNLAEWEIHQFETRLPGCSWHPELALSSEGLEGPGLLDFRAEAQLR